MSLVASKFKTEVALVIALLDFVGASKKPSRTFTALEFEAGYGIADIVFFRLKAHSESLRRNFLKLPSRLAVLFNDSHLPSIFSVEMFCRQSGSTVVAAKRILATLVNARLLHRLSNGNYLRIATVVCPVESIVSIEAKLTDWKRALRQAFRYREFSNQSWVLLDASRASSAIANLDIFQRGNIGLATFSTLKELRIHYEPSFENSFNQAAFWSASFQLTRDLKKSR